MSLLNILGGVGQGVQQGVGFMQQKKMQDEQLKLAQDRNTMLADQAKRAQTEFEQKQAEQQRVDELAKMRAGIYQNYPDANPYQRERMFVDEAVKANKFRGDELLTAHNNVQKLKAAVGGDAYGQMLAGNIKPLQSLLGERGISVDFTPDGNNLQLWQAGNARDAAGNLQPTTIPFDGILQMDGMSEAYRAALEQRKAGMDALKTRAEIGKINAQARREDRMYQDEVIQNEDGSVTVVPGGGRRSSGAGKSGAKSDGFGIMTAEDFGKAADKFVGDDPEFSMPRAYSLYTNMLENTRTADGRTLTPGQQAIALEDAIRITKGEGIQTPDLRDGRLALTANIDGRSYVLDRVYTEPQAMSLKDGEGAPRYTQQTVDDIYLDAVRSAAVQSPEQFSAAWQVFNDPEALSEAQQRYAEGDARMGDLLRAVAVIQRGVARANEAAGSGKQKGALSRAWDSLTGRSGDAYNPTPAGVPQDKAEQVTKKFGLDQREEVAHQSGALRPSADNKRFGEMSSSAQSALLKLRTNNKTLTASEAMHASEAIQQYPELQDRLKVTDEEVWALRLVAGSKQ